MALLEINGLDVRYGTDRGELYAVDDATFTIEPGETYGLVGESGCGKTTLGKAILQLLDDNGEIVGGEVWFDGVPPAWTDRNGAVRREVIEDDRYPVRADGMTDLTELEGELIRDIRWRDIALIPQSAMNALNPVYKVGDQIAEAILRHEPSTTEAEAHDRARDLLERVGIEPERADDYAHQYSGGMKQRAIIAMAMACSPDLLIADEPTTALDVIIQDRILDAIDELQAEFDVSILVISHDISVMAEICDRMAVMYGGKVMESGPKEAIFENTTNPYTLGLRNSFPTIERKQERLISIPGSPPTLVEPESGCRFADRCPFATEECTTTHPPMYSVERAEAGELVEAGDERTHRSACYRLTEVEQLRERATREETWKTTAESP